MGDIVNGKNKKCPNTLSNMIKIAEEMGNHKEELFNVYSHLEYYSDVQVKILLDVFEKLMMLDTDPNPLSSMIGESIEEEKKSSGDMNSSGEEAKEAEVHGSDSEPMSSPDVKSRPSNGVEENKTPVENSNRNGTPSENVWNMGVIREKISYELSVKNKQQSHLIPMLVFCKLFCFQPETHKLLLTTATLDVVVSNIESSDEEIRKFSVELLEHLLVSVEYSSTGSHQEVISTFLGDHYAEAMEVMRRLINSENKENRILALRLLQEIINRCGSVKGFSEQFLQDKENIKMVLEKMFDIEASAFQLLIIYLYTPKDMKSDAVNQALGDNADRLLDLLNIDKEEEEEDESLKREKLEAIQCLERIKMEQL